MVENKYLGLGKIIKDIPGLGVLFVLGSISVIVSEVVHISPLIVAVVVGLIISNLIQVPEIFSPGVDRYDGLLELGIIIMGTRVVVGEILESGLEVILFVIGFLIATTLTVEFISQYIFRLSDRLGSLLAAGMSVCGVSAVIAVAGGINAKDEDIAFAVATVLLFDAITLFIYPLVGVFLGLPDRVYGLWAGISMFSTGPVAAAGFAYSEVAGQWATITKLTRNVFIGVVALVYTVLYSSQSSNSQSQQGYLRYLWKNFPTFVLGFLGMILLTSLGIFTEEQTNTFTDIYNWLFIIAFVGLGMNIQLDQMRVTGIRPFLTVLISLVLVSTLSLLVALAIFR